MTNTTHLPAGAAMTNFSHTPALDGIRGLAIALVLIGHTRDAQTGVRTQLATLGVLIFFVLSGYLITRLLVQERTTNGDVSLRAFYVRRALRIAPAFLAYLGVVSLLAWTGRVSDTPAYAVLASLLFVRNIWGRGAATGHLWSLSLEEQFYAVWPAVYRWLGSSTLPATVVAIAGISLFRTVCMSQGWLADFSDAYGLRPWFRMDVILIGCAIALWQTSAPETRRVGTAWTAFVLACALAWWSLSEQGIFGIFSQTIETLLVAALFLNLALSSSPIVNRFLVIPPLRWLGRISYSLYLWQQIFTQSPVAAFGVLTHFPFNICASLLAAVASRVFVEAPFLRQKERWTARRRLAGRVESAAMLANP